MKVAITHQPGGMSIRVDGLTWSGKCDIPDGQKDKIGALLVAALPTVIEGAIETIASGGRIEAPKKRKS